MRQPQPYYKKTHRAWFANIGPNKRPVRLATEEEGEKAAWSKYHEKMADRQPVQVDGTAAIILDRYLEHCHLNLAESTYKDRRRTLESFAKYIGDLRLSALEPYHVSGWINELHRLKQKQKKKGDVVAAAGTEETSSTYRHHLIRTVKAAFRWGCEEGHIDASPVRKVKLPAPRSRDVYLTPEQWAQLVALVAQSRDRGCLSDIITVLKETGCRPQEARRVEARHFDKAERCWTFPVDESKGERDSRVVLLTDRAFEICDRLALKHPQGPIFRNSDGTAWTHDTLGSRLYRASKKLGFHVCPYAVRHTFATEAIIRGVDLVTIAQLMGHVDLKMLSRIYQHIRKRSDHLRAGLQKAVGQ